MAYMRVTPRDLFNEANLLKCLGRLMILLDNLPASGHLAVLDEGDGSPFDIQQDDSSGAIEVVNLPLRIGGQQYRLMRPLNSRQPWPLYAENYDDAVSVFTDDGHLSGEFLLLINALPVR
jgi:hypothetical protein